MSSIVLPFYQNQDGKICIHTTVYERTEEAVALWINSQEHDIWNVLDQEIDDLPEFLKVVLLFSALRNKIYEQDPQQIRCAWNNLKKILSRALNLYGFSPQEQDVIHMLFHHIGYLGSGEKPCFLRIASLLELQLTHSDIEDVHGYLQEQKEYWLHRPVSSTLDTLIQSELQRNAENFEGVLLPFLALQNDSNAPKLLRNVHTARSLAACWEKIEAEQQATQTILEFFARFEQSSTWSFGDPQEHVVVIALLENVVQPHFSWGKRRVIPFSSLLEALDFVWNQQPDRAWVTRKILSYPQGENCSTCILDPGIRIDDDAFFGYSSTEKVFLDGMYWSDCGHLWKDEQQENDKRQQEAKEELARLFLDMDELSSDEP